MRERALEWVPEMPFTKCGTAFARNAPPKKYATSWYQRMNSSR
jgi:hypothetical protein